jgi:hypothetical protein
VTAADQNVKPLTRADVEAIAPLLADWQRATNALLKAVDDLTGNGTPYSRSKNRLTHLANELAAVGETVTTMYAVARDALPMETTHPNVPVVPTAVPTSPQE